MEELFLKFVLDDLTGVEKARLTDFLAHEAIARRFVGFIMEWCVTADLLRDGTEAAGVPDTRARGHPGVAFRVTEPGGARASKSRR